MRKHFKYLLWILGVPLGCVIGLIAVLAVLDSIHRHNKHRANAAWEENIALLVSRYDAVRDWDKAGRGSSEDKEERRVARTKAIRNAIVRTDNKPVLMIGHIVSSTNRIDGGKHLLVILTRRDGFEVWVACDKELFERTISNGRRRVGDIAAIIRVDAVMEPTSEEEASVPGLAVPVSRLYPSTYCITGKCLDILTGWQD